MHEYVIIERPHDNPYKYNVFTIEAKNIQEAKKEAKKYRTPGTYMLVVKKDWTKWDDPFIRGSVVQDAIGD